MKRRKFIHQLGMGTMTAVLPSTLLSFTPGIHSDKKAKTLNFGIVADVHKDLIPDADQRLEAFIRQALDRKVDFIIQLGDFCFAETKNKGFLDIWDRYKGPKYHVLGNHDMDKNTKEEMLDFWGMPKTYYSYDFGGFHFIVLDANFLYQDGKFTDYAHANFYVDSKVRTFINDEQIEWFQADLQTSKLPTFVISHQNLWHSIKNRLTLQKIIEEQKEKVICCLSGHSHLDFHFQKNEVNYIGINSMSYQWSDKYTTTDRFPKELYNEYANLHHIAAYKDPLYAFAKVDPKGTMAIEGVKSDWMPPSPFDLGMPEKEHGVSNTPQISDFHLQF